MQFSPPPNIHVVALVCRVFQNWLEHLLPEGLTEDITFFDYALHRVPKNLQKTIQEAIDGHEQPSLVVSLRKRSLSVR
jgi:hypothetical protein